MFRTGMFLALVSNLGFSQIRFGQEGPPPLPKNYREGLPIPQNQKFETLFVQVNKLFEDAKRAELAGNHRASDLLLNYHRNYLELTNLEGEALNRISHAYCEAIRNLDAEGSALSVSQNFDPRIGEAIIVSLPPPPRNYHIQTIPQKIELLKKSISQLSSSLGEATFQKVDKLESRRIPAMVALPQVDTQIPTIPLSQ